MIDLRKKGLPNAIEVKGKSFLINTDFRIWQTFPERIEDLSNGIEGGYNELFVNRVPLPSEAVVEALGDFYQPPHELPRVIEENELIIDFEIDADYIFAAFFQCYGLDLTLAELHWHKFLALLAALPKDTALSEIMSYRSYKGNSKDPAYKEYMKLKQAWALPQKISKEEREAMEEFNNLFG